MNSLEKLWKKVVSFFLNKSTAKLETLERETYHAEGVELVLIDRRTKEAVRTWMAKYKTAVPPFDLIFALDTLEDFKPSERDDPFATHALHIYSKGFHAIWDPVRKVNVPDVRDCVKAQVILQRAFMPEKPELLAQRIFDRTARIVIEFPPGKLDPRRIDWEKAFEKIARAELRAAEHQVFVAPGTHRKRPRAASKRTQ